MFHHHEHPDLCPDCQDAPNWMRHIIHILEELMSADQDHLDAVTTRLEAAVTALNGAIVPPAPLNFAGLDQVVLNAEADVAALPVVPPA